MSPGYVYLFCLAIVGVACSAPPNELFPDREAATAGASENAAMYAGSTTGDVSNGGSGLENGAPGLGLIDEASPDGLGATCGGATFEPERAPLDMYFLVDSSGSMAEPTGSGANKWDLVSSALIDFTSEADRSAIGLGLGYFPEGIAPSCAPGEPGCLCIPFINLCLPNFGGSCDASDYATPRVPLALAPLGARVTDELRRRELAGGTPTRAALEGTYRYLESWAAQNPGRKVVAVLATDGEPTGCDANEASEVAALAAAALAGPSRIQTFVIGVGRALENLNEIARAGGSDRAYLTDTSIDLAGELAAALGAIRRSAGPCVFEIPEATTEGRIDPGRVNVRVTPAGAAAPLLLAKTFDGTPGACGPDGGWHYDDPANPTRIELCGQSCSAAASSRVEVQFGCDTVIAPR